MANGFSTAAGGGGGGDVILRAVGAANTTVTATLAGDGTKTKTGTIPANGFLNLKLPSLGVWTVVSRNGSYSFTQEVRVFRYGITECFALVNKPLAECSYAEMNTVLKSGLYSKVWSVGDKMRSISIDGSNCVFQIVGFDQDEEANGQKVPVSLVSVDQVEAYRFNNASWEDGSFRTETVPKIRNLLPKDFLKMIKFVKKNTWCSVGQGIDTYNWVSTMDDIWVPGQNDVSGNTRYAYFVDDNSRIKKAKGVAAFWNLRDFYDTFHSMYVTETGQFINYGDLAHVNSNAVIGCAIGSTL